MVRSGLKHFKRAEPAWPNFTAKQVSLAKQALKSLNAPSAASRRVPTGHAASRERLAKVYAEFILLSERKDREAVIERYCATVSIKRTTITDPIAVVAAKLIDFSPKNRMGRSLIAKAVRCLIAKNVSPEKVPRQRSINVSELAEEWSKREHGGALRRSKKDYLAAKIDARCDEMEREIRPGQKLYVTLRATEDGSFELVDLKLKK